jgi:5-methylcytosine-specific restriction endonuclease McrA
MVVTLPRRVCTRCPNLQPCPDHPKEWPKQERIAGGSGWEWARTRKRILARDGRICRLQLEGCTLVATDVDHRIPISAHGSDDDANLQASCSACNQRKARQEAAAARWRRS